MGVRSRWDKFAATVRDLRPRISSAYVTYIRLADQVDRRFDIPERYRFHLADDAADPALAFAPRWQRRLAAGPMARGEWFCLLAFDDELDGLRVGHVWVTLASTRGPLTGMLDVRLRNDEAYVWDLYIHPDHRKMSLGNAMGQRLIDTFVDQGVAWGYTHVLDSNTGSVIWHHLFGFSLYQMVNCIHAGDRFWWKVPLSDTPRLGPLSRKGRHNIDPPPDPFGGGLLPPEWSRAERPAPAAPQP
jgi:ribosomal protein S18 acetylase RimI-like enzyme